MGRSARCSRQVSTAWQANSGTLPTAYTRFVATPPVSVSTFGVRTRTPLMYSQPVISKFLKGVPVLVMRSVPLPPRIRVISLFDCAMVLRLLIDITSSPSPRSAMKLSTTAPFRISTVSFPAPALILMSWLDLTSLK